MTDLIQLGIAADADAATGSLSSAGSPAVQDVDHAAKIAGDLILPFDRILRSAGDDLYERLMYSVQEYLVDNVAHNLRSDLDSAKRQALHDRQRAMAADALVAELVAPLKRLADDYEQLIDCGDCGHSQPGATYQLIIDARAALTKATGGAA